MRHSIRITAALLALGTLAAGLHAQEPEEATITPEDAAAEMAGTAPEPAKPRPAEILPQARNSLLLAIAAAGPQQAVAVGERGNILASADGKTWQQAPVPVNSTLTAVAFADAREGWAVGHDSVILHSGDGGRSWDLQHFDAELEKPLLNLLVLDARNVYAVGAYGLFLQTGDGGAHWTEVEAPAVREEELHLNSIVRLNNGDLFIAGEAGMLGVRPADGTAWQRLTSPYEGSFFGALPWGERGALVYGLRGNIYLSDDARAGNWKRVDTGSKLSLFGGVLLPQRGALLVGADDYSVLIGPDGSHRVVTAPKAVGAISGGSLSGAIAWGEGLLMVGEPGIKELALKLK